MRVLVARMSKSVELFRKKTKSKIRREKVDVFALTDAGL